jgi:hypothetical protein
VHGLFVIGIRADVSNVGICQADNLARVTRIGEYFLISGEAGIENDFAAAPGDRSRRAPMKNAPIFERKYSLPCFSFGQWTLASAFARALRRTSPPYSAAARIDTSPIPCNGIARYSPRQCTSKHSPDPYSGQARRSALVKAGYFTDSAKTGIEPK